MIGIRHTGIYVQNLEKMKEFYCDNFSMMVAVHDIEKGKYIDTVLGLRSCEIELYKLRCINGTMIELLKRKDCQNPMYKFDGGEILTNTGCIHIALTVDDVDQTYQKLCKQGVEFISYPCTAPSGKAKVCFCKDIEGNYLELVEECNEELC